MRKWDYLLVGKKYHIHRHALLYIRIKLHIRRDGGNDILNKSHRTKYGETEIDPKKLNNPPNNKQVKDVQK